MSGICGVWRYDEASVTGQLGAVCSGLALVPSERSERRSAQEAGVGVSAAFATQQIFANDHVMVACDAALSNEGELRTWSAKDANTAALIGALYERFGCDFVGKLVGSFSLVIWDRRKQNLVAAVDRFGINRLVYAHNGKVFAIASRIDALMRTSSFSEGVNARAIANFLNFGVSLAPETVFKDVRRLSPGMLLVASKGQVRVKPYWDMRYSPQRHVDEERFSRQLESLVEKAVSAQCADGASGETGAYLSGGTDSSTVVGMMSRAKREPVKAFSIGFEDQQFNELEYAALAAKKFRADHHTYLVTAKDCFEALPHMVRLFDEPFGNSSAIPTYFCARLAAQNGVKVLLAGDGGDELFGGNERYRTDKIFHAYQTLPPTLRKGIVEPILRGVPFDGGVIGKARRYVRRSNLPGFERFFSYNFLCTHPPEEVFQPAFQAELSKFSVLDIPAHYYNEAPAKDHLDRLLYLDVKITLGDSDLPKVTQMSELAGIQTRFPFLDPAVANFSGTLPVSLKVKGLNKRYLFKRAFRDLLPAEIIKKPKHGFGIPVARWLKSDQRLREFCRDILFSARSLERGYFRREFLEDLIQKHEADDSTYYGDTVWTFLVLELWHRQYVDHFVGAPV